MGMKYRYKKIGIGVVDNLGKQLKKAFRGAKQGAISTRWRYVRSCERFIGFAGPAFRLQKLQNLADKHLQAYALHLKERGVSDAEVKNALSALRYLHRQIPQTKFELTDARKQNQKLRLGSTSSTARRIDRAWTGREIQEIQARARGNGHPEIADMIALSRYAGVRINECAALRRADAENALRGGYLKLTNTKGGRPRDVPLSPEARVCLEHAAQEVERGDYLFARTGERVHKLKQRVNKFISYHREQVQDADRCSSAHNVKNGDRAPLTFHGLRHSYARETYQRARQKGLTHQEAEHLVAQRLGHNRAEVTRIYTLT